MTHATKGSRIHARRCPRWVGRFVRLLTVRYLAGQALSGMLANPEWMKCAKEEAGMPGRGDIPHFFAMVATRYAHDCLNEIERLDE